MHARGLRHQRLVPTVAPVSAVLWSAIEADAPGVALPRAEAHLAVHLGSFELYAMGAQQRARRKLLRGGQQTLRIRLRLDVQQAVFGVPASALAGRVVSLAELWGEPESERLRSRMIAAGDVAAAASLLEGEIGRRVTAKGSHDGLVLAAATKLTTEGVHDVAVSLGVSDRHLRRVFQEAVGMSPKRFAKLSRFRRAIHDARANRHVDWAGVAAAAGYYDQAHLIGDFRELSGATPGALLAELTC